MAQDVNEKLATERAVKLPRHVRFFTRQSRKGLPAPACAVALERGIRIPMPDGTHQIADRYIPQTREPRPTLLVRTPYGRGFPYDFMYGGLFAEQGYNVLLQSTRGTGGSGGTLEPFTDEAADAQATIAWLREQPWFNGSLATIGASYLGFTQWALANDPPPELKAMVVQVSTDDFYGFLYPGGAFALEATLTGVAAMLSQDKGFRPFMGAVLRLMLTYQEGGADAAARARVPAGLRETGRLPRGLAGTPGRRRSVLGTAACQSGHRLPATGPPARRLV